MLRLRPFWDKKLQHLCFNEVEGISDESRTPFPIFKELYPLVSLLASESGQRHAGWYLPGLISGSIESRTTCPVRCPETVSNFHLAGMSVRIC